MTPVPSNRKDIGLVNWIGFRTLIGRELKHYFGMPGFTLVAPAVTSLLFLTLLTVLLPGDRFAQIDLPVSAWLAPGLIAMAMYQAAFEAASFSVLEAKVEGTIIDTLMAPLSAIEITLGYVVSGVISGVGVGFCVALVVLPFAGVPAFHPGQLIVQAIGGAMIFSAFGVITGLWSERYENHAAISYFALTPLVMLSGIFYSVSALPEPAQLVTQLNPVHYLIDGFRAGFIGQHDSVTWPAPLILILGNIALTTTTVILISKGYKLKP